MKNKKVTMSRAQIEALFFLWSHYEDEAKKFLEDIGITITDRDQMGKNDYIQRYISNEEFAQYSDTDRR